MNEHSWASALSTALVVSVCLTSASCIPSYGGSLATARAPVPGDTCELRLFIEHTDGTALGVSAVEMQGTSQRAGVCVKEPNQALAMPNRVTIKAIDLSDFGYLCSGPATQTPSGQVCLWNGVYRNAYPFSFTFVAKPGTKITDYIALARVYRNGSLIARYNAASVLEDPRKLKFRASDLQVPEVAFAKRPPHLAELDLRVLPAGASLAPALLDEKLVDYRDDARQRLANLGQAVAPVLLPGMNATIDCFVARVKRLQTQAQAVVEPSAAALPAAIAPATCTTDVAAAPPTSLRTLYETNKDQTKAQLDTATNQAQLYLQQLQAALPQARAYVAPALAALPAARVEAAVKEADALVANAASTADDALALAKQLRTASVAMIEDRKVAAKAYEAAVQSLENSGTVLEAYGANPPTQPDEQRLEMRHGDRTQFFFGAPWNGIPISLASGGSKGELDITRAIPILDVVGVRVQWAASRFADVRVGAGVMYFRDLEVMDEMAGTTEEKFTPAMQANLGIANLKVGLAYAPGSKQPGSDSKAEDVLRVLIGTDLYKIISGSNAEAF